MPITKKKIISGKMIIPAVKINEIMSRKELRNGCFLYACPILTKNSCMAKL